MLGFLLALAAGFLAPHAEGPLARPVAAAIAPQIPVEPAEMRLLSFLLLMLIAAVVATLLDSGSVLGFVAGGAIGYFGTRIFAALRLAVEGRPRR